jgi:hypothetical protein
MVFRPLTAGMLTEAEAAARLGIHELTLVRWVEYAIIKRHVHNQHPYFYELLDTNLPAKHSSRWPKKMQKEQTIRSTRRRCSVKPATSRKGSSRSPNRRMGAVRQHFV